MKKCIFLTLMMMALFLLTLTSCSNIFTKDANTTSITFSKENIVHALSTKATARELFDNEKPFTLKVTLSGDYNAEKTFSLSNIQTTATFDDIPIKSKINIFAEAMSIMSEPMEKENDLVIETHLWEGKINNYVVESSENNVSLPLGFPSFPENNQLISLIAEPTGFGTLNAYTVQDTAGHRYITLTYNTTLSESNINIYIENKYQLALSAKGWQYAGLTDYWLGEQGTPEHSLAIEITQNNDNTCSVLLTIAEENI